jgi:signal transduction histidine kinase
LNSKTKVIIGFILISATLTTTGYWQYSLQLQSQALVDEILDSSLTELTTLEDMHTRVNRIIFLTVEVSEKLIEGAPMDDELTKEQILLNSEIISTKESLDIYLKEIRETPDETLAAQKLSSTTERFISASADLLNFAKQGIDAEEDEILFFAVGEQLSHDLSDAINVEVKEINSRQNTVHGLFTSGTVVLIFGIALSLSIAAIVSLSVGKSITKFAASLKLWVDEISNGDFNVILRSKPDSDFNDLYLSINMISKKLDDYKRQLIKNERLSTIGEISSRLTHDIRTPLTIIQGSIQIIENAEKNTDSPTLRKHIPMIKSALERISSQINDVLGYVRVTPLHLVEISLLSLVNDVIKTLEIPNGIQIILPSKDIMISCDPQKLKIVFENLILNAVDAIGDNPGKISFSVNETDTEFIISVEDTGKGISESDMPHIFDPLYTTKHNGTGLGLLSCKNISEQHGGKIFARNSVDKGAIFTLVLPKHP